MLATQVEIQGTTARVDFDNTPVPLFEHRGSGGYFTLWDASGRVQQCSPSLENGALPWHAPAGPDGDFQHILLPGGQTGRMFVLPVKARPENGGPGGVAAPTLVLGVARSTTNLEAVLRQVLWLTVGVGGAAIGVLVLVLATVVRRGLSPLEKVAAAIVAVEEHDLSAPSLPTACRRNWRRWSASSTLC